MTFNYKIIVDKYKGEEFFQIHRVYYDEDDIPVSYSEESVPLFSDESIKDLAKMMRMMSRAMKEPALWGGDRFPEEYKKIIVI